MFERRLKILLIVLTAVALVLFGRAFSLQVWRGADYAQVERQLATRPPELTAMIRGRIVDAKGVELAVDTACTDACVDYRAIIDPPDPKWVEQVAAGRLRQRYGAGLDYRKQFPAAVRKQMLADEKHAVESDIAAMWATLAMLYNPADAQAAADAAASPTAAMDAVRREIVRTVELRRRVSWTKAYDRSRDRSGGGGESWLRWLTLSNSGGGGINPPAESGPDIDAFQSTIEEQQQPHVVLHALDDKRYELLGRYLEKYPGLTLRPSMHRSYPLGEVACHLLGRVGNASADELHRTRDDDPRSRYEPVDDVGRDGVEALCEPLLRGLRGRVDRSAADPTKVVSSADFQPGTDVRLTVDAGLQARVQQLLKHVVIRDGGGRLVTPPEGVSMHAAAVVLDVPTNRVLALASNPTFDANELESRYAALAADTLEASLRNRALVDAMNPGSTAKPMVGLGAITAGAIGPRDGIECTGFLVLPGANGRPIRYQQGRCWIVSENATWLKTHPVSSLAHHPFPTPHRGIFGNADGFLTYSDALERSCNVYFETVADRLGPAGLDHWLEAFGMGRPTGIGLYESPGQRPGQTAVSVSADPRFANCLTGIGQGTLFATPLQIANEAATLARDGVWMRPRLLSDETQAALDRARPPATTRPRDRDDLHLDADGLAQAKIGMTAVVEQAKPSIWKLAGVPQRPWLTAAAKTGTADVSRLLQVVTDEHGNKVRKLLDPVVRGGPETATPWYRSSAADGKTVTQNWYMGYAPADHPQVAFAVLIEYAGSSGGMAGGPVAAGVLDACVADGYLREPGVAATMPTTQP